MTAAAQTMPRDAALYGAVVKLWEAHELAGWNPDSSPLRAEVCALYIPPEVEFDWEAVHQLAKQLNQERYGSPDPDKTLQALQDHLEGRKSQPHFRELDIQGQPVWAMSCLPSAGRPCPSFMYQLQRSLSWPAMTALVQQLGLKWAYVVHP